MAIECTLRTDTGSGTSNFSSSALLTTCETSLGGLLARVKSPVGADTSIAKRRRPLSNATSALVEATSLHPGNLIRRLSKENYSGKRVFPVVTFCTRPLSIWRTILHSLEATKEHPALRAK